MSQIVSKVQEESRKRDVDFETTKKTIFARIAAYRVEHPFTYSGKFPAEDAVVGAKVASILDRAQKEQHR